MLHQLKVKVWFWFPRGRWRVSECTLWGHVERVCLRRVRKPRLEFSLWGFVGWPAQTHTDLRQTLEIQLGDLLHLCFSLFRSQRTGSVCVLFSRPRVWTLSETISSQSLDTFHTQRLGVRPYTRQETFFQVLKAVRRWNFHYRWLKCLFKSKVLSKVSQSGLSCIYKGV